MPIYEYQCSACGHRLEAIQRFSDDPLSECPHCGEARLKKLISAAGFRLSGKGWYETDFKNSKQRNLTSKDSAEQPSTKSGDANSGDSKESKSDKSTDKSKQSKSDKQSTGAKGAGASSASNN